MNLLVSPMWSKPVQNSIRIMYACVSFETVMVVEPAVRYNVDEIHLFHYVRDPSQSDNVYSEFYEEVVSRLRASMPTIRIVEHASDPIYNFQKMLRCLLTSIEEVKTAYGDPEILINSSAGPSEFSAAAIVSALMTGTTAFTVGTKAYTVPKDRLRELYYENGRPVGLTSEIFDPRPIPAFDIDKPDENLVRSLRLYSQIREAKHSVTAVSIISALKNAGLWEYEPNIHEKKTDFKQKEIMYYQRHYIQAWQKYKWIDKPSSKAKYDLTEDGKNIIMTFYVDGQNNCN